MFNFSMKTNENFASFRDQATGQVVFVDTFDNHEFNVRFGTVLETTSLGVIQADTDLVLNEKLRNLVNDCMTNDNNSNRDQQFRSQH